MVTNELFNETIINFKMKLKKIKLKIYMMQMHCLVNVGNASELSPVFWFQIKLNH